MWHVAGRKWACSPFTVPMTFRHEPVERTEAASRKATKSGTVQKNNADAVRCGSGLSDTVYKHYTHPKNILLHIEILM